MHHLAFSEVFEGSLATLLEAAESCGEHGLQGAVGLGPSRCEKIRHSLRKQKAGTQAT